MMASFGTAEEDCRAVIKEEMKDVLSMVEAQQSAVRKLEEENQMMKEEIKSLKDVPVFIQCVYQDDIDSDFGIGDDIAVFWDKEYYTLTNEWTSGAGFDLRTGVFTSPISGTFSFSYSMEVYMDAGEEVRLFMRTNGKLVSETYHFTKFEGPADEGYDQGGRRLVTHLNAGETFDLYCADCNPAHVKYILLCVELLHSDAQ